ncbi:MAG: hypothetical protein R3F37_18810 [Candidatus Competibacteraceae bacterium]
MKQLMSGVLEKFGVKELVKRTIQIRIPRAMATQPAGQAEPNTVMHVVRRDTYSTTV